jgi:hypothetical protein
MAAVHDGEANVSGAFTAATSVTLAGKTTAGSDRCGAASVGWNSETPNISSGTWNGSAMTIVDQWEEVASASLGAGGLRIVAPATASSNVVVNFDASATGYAVASSYNGVDQTTPVSNSNRARSVGTPIAASNTVTTASDEVLVDAVSWTQFDTTAPTVGANQTQLLNQLYASFYFVLASRQSGADGGAMTWSLNAHWVSIGFSLKAAGGAATAVKDMIGGYIPFAR